MDSIYRLVESDTADEIFQIIIDEVFDYFNNSVIMIFQIDSDNAHIRLKKVSQLEDSLIAKVFSLMGFDPFSKKYPLLDLYVKNYSCRKIFKYPSFSEFAGNVLPSYISTALQPILGVKEVYSIGLSGKNGVLGSVVILDRNKQIPVKISKLESFIVSASMVLERIYIQQNVQKLNNELIRSKEKAVESDKLKSAFLANMSHEIRTPMNGLIGFAEMLLRPNTSEEKRRQYADIVRDSCKQLLSIINDIIDISKIEAGQLQLYQSEVAVDQLMKDVFSFFKLSMEKKKLKFSYSVDLQNTNDCFMLDEIKLKQVLNNLIINALKFTEVGFVKFSCQEEKKVLRFCVSDSGMGISEEDQAIIFKRFRQSDRTQNYGGTGLGLAISKAFIEFMGGKIWFESKIDEGTNFFIEIPKILVNNEINIIIPEKIKKSQFDKIVILVAEDEDINYLYLEEVFANTGAKLIRAINGKNAVEIVKDNSNIDIILMDLKMPILNGYEATKQIKSFNPQLPILALTAYALTGDKLKAMAAGCDDYLTKPFNEEDLFDKITSWVTV